MTFFAGQKVVCIDDRRVVSVRVWLKNWVPISRWVRLDHNLNRGDVYRIVCIATMKDTANGNVVQLLHVDGAAHFEYPEIGFPSFQFRPLIEKKTDISVFTKMLNDVRHTERV